MKPSICLSGLCLILSTYLIVRAQKPESIVQIGHSNVINSVAISPDGKILASGSRDRTIRLWETATGRELRTIADADEIWALSFSPDGETLASASGSEVKIWDIRTGARLRVLGGHRNHAGSLAYSADGKILGSGSSSEIKLWDASTGAASRTFSRETSSSFHTTLALSPDGATLAGVTDDQEVTLSTCEDCLALKGSMIVLWDTATGTELKRLTAPAAHITNLAFSADGKILAGGNWDGTIILWDVSAGVTTLKLTGHAGAVNSVAFGEGQTLASGGSDGTVRVWDGPTGTLKHTLNGHRAGVTSVAFSRDGRTLASGSGDRTIKLWEATTGTRVSTLEGYASNVTTAALDPQGRFLASGTSNGLIKLWDLYSDAPPRSLVSDVIVSETATYMTKVGAVAFSPDGKTLASGGTDKGVKLWDVSTGERKGTLTGDSAWPLAFTPDGKYLAGVEYNKIKLWDPLTGKLLVTFEDFTLHDQINSIAFSSDGKTLLSGSNDHYTRIWDVSTGSRSSMFELQSDSQMTRIFLSPDGKSEAISHYMVVPFRSSPNHGTIDLLQIDGGDARLLKGLGGLAGSVAFTPNGKLVAGGDSYGKIILWDRATGEQRHILSGHSNSISSLAFSGNSGILMSGSEDGATKLWDASTGRELATLLTFGRTDWLVVTPDGLFDGSPAAWKQIIYRFNNNTLDYTPVEAFYNEFYYPGLLTEIMAGKRPPAPQGKDIRQKDRRQIPVRVRTVDKIEAGAPLTSRSLTIEVEVEEAVAVAGIANQAKRLQPSGAKDIRLFRNGTLVKLWHGDWGERDGCKLQPPATPQSPRRTICRATVRLVAGQNRFTAYAFNRDNIKSSDYTMIVTGDDILKRKGVAYVLAIGVNRYANPDYDLSYSADDARAFSAEIQRQQLRLDRFERPEVRTLLDHQATKANILRELRQLKEKAQPEDAVIIYFAGHGTAQQNRFYLIPHDLGYMGPREKLTETGLKMILSHSISDLELEQAVEGIDAGQLSLVIDACNSGQALEAEEKRRGPMNSKGLAQLAYEKGMYILTAAQSYQLAKESSLLGHGYLTFALVEEGLKTAKADASKDGAVTQREWLDYATTRVPQMQEQKRRQRPQRRQRRRTLLQDDANVQRPRVFYRREVEVNPLIVAKP